MSKTSDPRRLLRAAIASRTAARQHREEMAGSLSKADAVLEAAQNERNRAQSALAHAEHEQATTIAQGIRSGENPDTGITAAIKSAHATLLECESRARMAKQARDQIADELKLAESELIDTEAAVSRAALDVVYAEIASQCNLAKVDAAINVLVDAYDLINGIARIWLDGHAMPLPPPLAETAARLAAVNTAVNMLHGERPGLSPPPEEQTTRRLQNLMAALANDPETKLSDNPTPLWTPPKPPSINVIEQDRERGARAWATALGNGGKVVSVG